MKKLMLMMLMLASGFVTISARAEVGKDKAATDCKQVIQQTQEQLKKNRPAAVDSTAPLNGTVPNAGSAQ